MYARDPQVELVRHFESIEDFYEQIDFEPHIEFDNWLTGDGAWARPARQREVAEDMAIILESWLEECDAESRRVVQDAMNSFSAQAELSIWNMQFDLHAYGKQHCLRGKYLVDGATGFVKVSEYGITLAGVCGDPGKFIPWGDIRYFEPIL